MSKNKNPAIKLFGKRIQLGSSLDGDTMIACGLEPPPAAGADSGFECNSCDDKLPSSKQGNNWSNERCSTGVSMDEDQEEESSSTSSLEESKSQSNISENPKTLSNDKLCSSQDPVHREDHSDETSSNQSQAQNPPKKPDEILPCPRCNSMVTKFCYFNNYNVKQPRHFCKNCQRYWTARGSMRNVPVGSGRRKNKNSLVSQSTPEAHVGLTYQATRSNSRVLGSESGATTLENNRGKSPPSAGLNGFMRPEMRILSPGGGSGNHGKGTPQGLIPPQVAYFPGSPWPCAWNPIPCQSGCPPPWPPFYPPASPQWVCNPPGSWNLHLLPNPSIYPDPYSPFLGKHYRDGTMLMPSASNNEEPPEEKTSSKPTISMPKTLRIVDDPIEVAGSSVWSTLGGNKDKPGSSNLGGGLFGGFHQHKDINPEGINTNAEVSHLANRANPAAFSRSLSFHEERQ